MTRPLVQYGSTGNFVVELQELLNKWILREDGNYDVRYCKPDGAFGPNTLDIVKSYQRSMFLSKDGVVGAKTWAALLGTETYNCFDIPATFVRAPNKYQCWAGATAMELKQNAPNTTKPPGVLFETLPGGLTGGIENSHENMQKFATSHGLQMYKGEGFRCLQLTKLIDQYGRLMLQIKGVNSSMTTGSPDDSHVVNLVGARGNGQPDGTTFTINNPSGDGSGMVIIESYQYLKAKYPKLSYQVFCRFSNRSAPIK
ncbi:MAG: peptidoglycan-binding domain-containing protein [Pyrinomonadaceae bacterium]